MGLRTSPHLVKENGIRDAHRRANTVGCPLQPLPCHGPGPEQSIPVPWDTLAMWSLINPGCGAGGVQPWWGDSTKQGVKPQAQSKALQSSGPTLTPTLVPARPAAFSGASSPPCHRAGLCHGSCRFGTAEHLGKAKDGIPEGVGTGHVSIPPAGSSSVGQVHPP